MPMNTFTKKIVIPCFLVITILVLNFREAKTNHAAPPLGGLSGDPARTSCALIGCHYGTTYTFPPGALTWNMGVTQGALSDITGQTYTLGQTYYMEFKPDAPNGNRPKYGFQMTSLDAAGNMAGSFTITDASRTSAQNLLGRNYIGHANADLNNDWVFQWTAPDTAAGPITFYYAANMANGDATNSGDSIFLGTVVLNPSGASGIGRVENEIQFLSLYPNPASDIIFLSFYNATGTSAQISLLDLEGREVQSEMKEVLTGGNNTLQYIIPGTVNRGIYLLKLQVGAKISVRRIVLI